MRKARPPFCREFGKRAGRGELDKFRIDRYDQRNAPPPPEPGESFTVSLLLKPLGSSEIDVLPVQPKSYWFVSQEVLK
jgi:hypothetical protein